jgi:hypothetical protein
VTNPEHYALHSGKREAATQLHAAGALEEQMQEAGR